MNEPSTEERLETGELLPFSECPFPIPDADDRRFLGEQRLHRAKEIAYEPERDRLSGFVMSDGASRPPACILAAASADALRLGPASSLPQYANELVPLEDMPPSGGRGDADVATGGPQRSPPRRRGPACVGLPDPPPRRQPAPDRPARLGHVDASGRHLRRAGPEGGLRRSAPAPMDVIAYLPTGSSVVVRHFAEPRSAYDDFMLSFANDLKLSDEVQERSPRKTWRFCRRSVRAWRSLTGLVHAELAGPVRSRSRLPGAADGVGSARPSAAGPRDRRSRPVRRGVNPSAI